MNNSFIDTPDFNSSAPSTPVTADAVRNSDETDDWLRQQQRYHNPEVEAAHRRMIATLGISNAPQLIMMPSKGAMGAPMIAAGESQSGQTYIAINPLSSFTNSELIAALSHELGHIALGHTKPESRAHVANADTEVNRSINAVIHAIYTNDKPLAASFADMSNPHRKALERQADSISARLCQGNETAALLERFFEQSAKRAPKGITPEDAERLNAPEHPLVTERITQLRTDTGLYEKSGICPPKPPEGRGR